MPSEISFGFVGLGSFGQSLAEACERCPGIRIGAGYDASSECSSAFASRFGCTQAKSFERLCQDPTLEGLVIASPNHLHGSHAIAGAEAGKHIFVEKPLAVDLATVDRIIAACRDAGRLLAVGHQLRRSGPYRAIKRMIAAGELGRIFSFEANHCGNLLQAWPADDWRFGPEGTGPLLHKGIHKIDVLNYLLGPARSVATLGTALGSNPSMHETTVSILDYDGGIVGSLSTGFRYNNASFNLYGERRSIRYDGHGSELRIREERNWEVQTIECGSSDPLAEELTEFADAIRGRTSIEVDGAVAREAIVLAIAATDAARLGSAVVLDDYRKQPILPTLSGSVA